MCGIAGFLAGYDASVARRMASRLAHRGPDDEAFFIDPEAGIALAHRRLSIIDLGPSGRQPMVSRSGRFVICYNGEIYNYRELKAELEARGVEFRTMCDTEVVLELFELDGPASLSRLIGIFAFAMWDAHRRELFLIRDGVGVKPLYVTRTPSGLAFASEIKALLELPDLDRTLDPTAAASYLSYLWSPGPRTMFRSVRKVEPGSWEAVRREGAERSGRFYRFPDPAPDAALGEQALIEGTREALATAVERQMVADVEVGAFLSGGLDSSSVVALAKEHGRFGPLKCFTIDYEEKQGEAGEMVADLPYARRAAHHLGVELHEIKVDAGMANDFEKLIYHLDEPEADPAALNSLYIASLARDHGIKVLLSGTGADDIFTGYRRHQAVRFDHFWGLLPGPVRQGIAGAARHLPTASTGMRRARKLLESVEGNSAERLARVFEWLSPEAVAALMTSEYAVSTEAVRAPLVDELERLRGHPPVERVLRLDQRFFLTDHNLNYTDKTGMAEGVEIRVPFLDPDLMAWAARVPVNAKMRGGATKWVLRKAMEPILPHDIIYRPKTGFGIPLRSWLRKDMRPMMEELLSPASLSARGLFDPEAISALKSRTLAGRQDGSYALLGLMAVELWCRRFVDA